MSASTLLIEQHARDRIALVRILCVFFMIYVHVPTGQSEAVNYVLGGAGLSGFVQGFLVEGPGRAGAALLSMVSGYLAAISLSRPGASAGSLYRRRFVSIVLPMVLWGLATVAVYLLVSQIRVTFLSNATTWLDKLNIVLFLTEMPNGATMHLGFLRDLYVCILLSPLLLLGVQRVAGLLLPLLAAFYLLEHGQGSVIILRPLVLFAFTIGLFLADRKIRLNALDAFWPLFCVLAIVATLAIMAVNGGAAAGTIKAFSNAGLDFTETVLYPLSRLFGSLAIWTLLPILMGGQIQSSLLRLSPYLFAAFCSHYLMLTLVFFGVWHPLFGDRHSDAYIVFFLTAPGVAMIVALIIVQIAVRIAPLLAILITGGRIRKPVVAPSPMTTGRRPIEAYRDNSVSGHIAEVPSELLPDTSQHWLEASRRLILGRR